MDAIVTAGGIPVEGEPLYPATRGDYKALLDIAGKPMIQWVLDALNASKQVGRIVVVGLPPSTQLASRKPTTFIANQNGMLENIRAGAEEITRLDPGSDFTLAVSSDLPALKGEMVDWLIKTVEETTHDVYYNIITRGVMEKRFPGSRRTYTHLKGLEVCGGDINAIRASALSGEKPIWDRIISARKSPLRQASLIGFDTLLLLLLRQLSVAAAEAIISQRLGFRGRAILCPYAEMGMDVDKPHQLEIMRADLSANRANELAVPA